MSETEGEISRACATPDARSAPRVEARAREIALGGPRAATWMALAAAIVLALVWTIALSRERSWGWDESMHAELPAARMIVATRMGRIGDAFRALLDCSQYPFVYPSVLAVVEGAFGISEHVARVVGRLAWCATLFGLFLLGGEIARSLRRRRDEARAWTWLPWSTMSLGALSPLALAYSGTLFLETPFTCAAVFALRAWMRRLGDVDLRSKNRRDLAAGAWISAAFFVKYNYGLMLGAGFVADWILQGVSAARTNALREHLRRALWLASIPIIALIWWFVLPIPGGFAVAHDHRTAFVEFLSGNQSLVTPFAYKPLNACAYFALNPRLMLLQLVGIAASARFVFDPTVRCLWIAFVFLWLPVWLHPFHLDRFFIPGGAAIWPLAALGGLSLIPLATKARVAVLVGLAVIVAIPIDDTLWLADAVGFGASDPSTRAYQSTVFASRRDLSGAVGLPTNGLNRSESDAMLDAIARETKPEERVAWIGLSNELSPAALHIGLLQRGGSRERFLRDASQQIDVTYFNDDPRWSDARLEQFAGEFDVILATDPVTLKIHHDRDFMREYCDRLTEKLGYRRKLLAQVPVALPTGPAREIKLYACRKP